MKSIISYNGLMTNYSNKSMYNDCKSEIEAANKAVEDIKQKYDNELQNSKDVFEINITNRNS